MIATTQKNALRGTSMTFAAPSIRAPPRSPYVRINGVLSTRTTDLKVQSAKVRL